MGYKPGQRDYSGNGNDLGVSTLLEGSAHRAADRVRVSVNLIVHRLIKWSGPGVVSIIQSSS
jgi:TolB-like protein